MKRLLFFDNGNYSRSPAAEVICRTLAEKAGRDGDFAFASAGLIDKHVGGPADPRTVAAVAARGYTLDGFICRQATPAIFAEFDEVLAMDAQNLAALRLARRDGDRARVDFFLPNAEVPDPYYGGDAAFGPVIDAIEARARAIVGA
ncbi:MAG: low molecular weight phosphotyrosine protein phosphatase [Pseudomonadota bacterium]